jgi:hypothetical protein
MGQILLAARLVARDLRHRPGPAALLLVAITAATTVLTLALALHGVTSQPYQQTRAATNGPDAVAYLPVPVGPGPAGSGPAGPGPAGPSPAAAAAELIHHAGVTAHSGPYPLVTAVVRAHGLAALAEAEGRAEAPAAVDQPKLTAGSWVRPGGVVIERTFAQALGVSVGDRVTLGGRRFTVAGIAVTAAMAPYPNICYMGAGSCFGNVGPGAGHFTPSEVGLIWTTEPDAMSLTTPASPVAAYVLNLKLSSPASAAAFAGQGPGPGAGVPLITWEGIANADGLLVSDEQSVLLPGAWLAGLLAAASVVVLAGGRMAERTRRTGLLKAVGATPGLVTAVLLAENLVLALLAAAAGLAAGWLAAPLITSPGAALVGAPGAPSLPLSVAGEVTGAAVLIALAATIGPAIRAARTSTVSALDDTVRKPRRGAVLIALSARLPVPLLLGLRLVARRPRRALLASASTAVTASGIVAVLTFRATVAVRLAGVSRGLGNPVIDRDEQMLLVLTVVLVALTVLNAAVAAWATVLDGRRAFALARALGAAPSQVSAGIVAAQVIPAVPGALLGIPLGLGLFAAASQGGSLAVPPVWWLAAATVGTLAFMALLASIPARLGARRPPAQVLQAETA